MIRPQMFFLYGSIDETREEGSIKRRVLTDENGIPPFDSMLGKTTENFLGKQWWSLPAVLLGALALIWSLLEWSGAIVVARHALGAN